MAEPAPQLRIPSSENTVDVRIIDTTARIKIPLQTFIKDPLPGHELLQCPAYSFLVEHPSGRKVLFDLGIRKDVNGLAPAVLNRFKGKVTLDVEDDVAGILKNDGRVGLEEINSIIWSHWHMDHSGDPSTFPSTTELVVGPGFKEALLPGYPANPESPIRETDYQGRDLREVSFDAGLHIGRFPALDYFGDGSFYLLDSPGHTYGHMCALARTTPSTFIFMGGDACHHCGSLRPTKHISLPDHISPSPFSNPPHLDGTICPGELIQSIHPANSRTEPFYPSLSPAPDRDVAKAEASLGKMQDFDASEDVLVAIAHDSSLLSVVDFFPKRANEWKEKGWKQTGRWRFLEDFYQAARDKGA